MKHLLLAVTVIALHVTAHGQGTVLFNNRVAGSLVTQVFFAVDPGGPKSGNTAGNTPTGTQIYLGAPLTGSGWTASLWAAPGNVIPAGVPTPYGVIDPSLQLASVNATTTFRTGTAAGNWAGVTTTLTGVAADAAAAVIQVRVYPTSFGSWANAVTAFNNGDPLAEFIGALPMFVLNNIGGTVNTPPVMTGLVSFSIGPIPEPSTFALLAIGLAGLLARHHRRRKESRSDVLKTLTRGASWPG